MARNNDEAEGGLRRVWGIMLFPLCLFVALSLFSYDWRDISLLKQPTNYPLANLIGPIGAWLSFVVFMCFGVGAYMIPPWLLALGVILIFSKKSRVWPRVIWGFVMVLAISWILELYSEGLVQTCRDLNIVDTGGITGYLIMHSLLIKLLSPVGAGILVWSLFVVSLILFIGIGNIIFAGRYIGEICIRRFYGVKVLIESKQDKRSLIEQRERLIEKQQKRLEKTIQQQERLVRIKQSPAAREIVPEKKEEIKPARDTERQMERDRKVETKMPDSRQHAVLPAKYTLPPLSLLSEVPEKREKAIMTDSAIASKILTETLAEFGIEAEVTDVQKGPVVTRYELLPAPGVRVERIAGLSNNLALSLKATSVRIQAPVPGKGVVGIEVPNITANMVYLREIIEGETWRTTKALLPLVLGKDVAGKDIVADLAEMPHLLVAGATGAGKTVCMNSILAGLLMARTPDQLRLMLIDPKIVEFSVYNNLPHLVVPVITDAKKVGLGLRWAINEMEKRYKLFARTGVRNIEGYNSREIVKQENQFGGTLLGDGTPPDKVPYIVIIIDELADLMLVAQAEVENCIARLAQLSRAVGIHIIISTQRPSVNVITGTIKANFPARIAFQVAQKVDSRTIIDTMGADKLLGNGDMLFLPPGTSKMVRAQGAYSTDTEIRNIVDFIKNQGEPVYELDIKRKLEKADTGIEAGEEDDEMISQAIEIIRETNRASTSSLQRRLRIGYTRAARIMDILEERGIVGPPKGADPREILTDLDGGIPDNQADTDDKQQ